jgi:hypothetical protein
LEDRIPVGYGPYNTSVSKSQHRSASGHVRQRDESNGSTSGNILLLAATPAHTLLIQLALKAKAKTTSVPFVPDLLTSSHKGDNRDRLYT